MSIRIKSVTVNRNDAPNGYRCVKIVSENGEQRFAEFERVGTITRFNSRPGTTRTVKYLEHYERVA